MGTPIPYPGIVSVFLGHSARAALSISALLVFSIVVTGFATSAYKNQRAAFAREHYERGQQLTAQGQLGDAVEEYRQALLFSPDNTEYRVSLVKALISDGRLDEAQTHLEQLLQEDPTNGVLNLMLARVALLRHQTKQAIAFYQRAVYEYWPASQVDQRRRARWDLVNLLTQAGRRNEAVGELMQLYANTPADTNQKRKIGFMLLHDDATSEAFQVFHDLLRTSPNDPEAHRGLAESYFVSGDYVSSRHEFQRAIRLGPSDRESIDGLALANSIIDLDPGLAGITAAERLRRSENLLRHVLTDLDQCRGTSGPDTRLEQAQDMLNAKHQTNADAGLAMQQTAEQLWASRAELCSSTPVPDRALETVLARIGQ